MSTCKGDIMCMPHGSAQTVSSGYERKTKSKKSIAFNEKLMKADPDFIDERAIKSIETKDNSLLSKFFSAFK